jgi:cytochrome c-type biogenesis protein CcmH/NrfG
VQLATNDATSWNNLGYALLQLNRPGDAVAPLEHAVLINPSLRSAWLNLSQAARLSGRAARAKVAEQKGRALPKDPNEINFK